ncbi:MAG: hypothetical protein ACW98Y_12710 [Candidatus Thorarchaeota archaeon]
MSEFRRWSIIILISFSLIVFLPRPVPAPPFAGGFKLGPPFALDQNLTLVDAVVDIEVTSDVQDEDFHYYTNMDGVYYIQSTYTGNYSIAYPLLSATNPHILSSQVEFFWNGQQIQYLVLNSSDLEFNNYIDPNDFSWFLDQDIPTAVFNSTIVSDTESILGMSLSCHVEGWGNFFQISYWVDTDDFWIPYSTQTVSLIVNNYEFLDDFEYTPHENLTVSTSGNAKVGRWSLSTYSFEAKEVGFTCEQYEYHLPYFEPSIEPQILLVVIVLLGVTTFAAYRLHKEKRV